VQLYRNNRAAHSTAVHNIWLGKPNLTMPKRKRATTKRVILPCPFVESQEWLYSKELRLLAV